MFKISLNLQLGTNIYYNPRRTTLVCEHPLLEIRDGYMKIKDDILEWLNACIENEWNFDQDVGNFNYAFWFTTEDGMVLFKMIWG